MTEGFIEKAKLNDMQRRAATTTEGPLLILAGAGSGKTRVITHRIAHLIKDKMVDPRSILAITFTNKAAKEMKERVEDICGGSGSEVWISTFHSSCVRILHREIEALGYGKEFTIYDDDDQLKLISDILTRKELSPKDNPPKDFRYYITEAKNRFEGPAKMRELASNERENLFADVYEEYEKRMKASNALDFDDLLIKTVILFSKFPDVLQKYAKRFRYIHVDEYQDTNMVQYRLIKQLSSYWNNICVVGDDDQSIYGWRGADIRNILEFEKDFKNTTVVKLEQNYRSTNNILISANTVIANNTSRKEKKLWSDKGQGDKIRVEEVSDGRSEAFFVLSEITEQNRKGTSYNDFAVLYRTNSQSRIIEEMLLGSGVPYSVYGGQPFYSRKEIKDAIAYLRILTNPDDEIALKRIINVPKRGIGDSAVNEIAEMALANDDSMLGAIISASPEEFSGRVRSKIVPFAQLIDDLLSNSLIMNPCEFVDYMLDKTGLLDMYRRENTDEAKDRLSNLEEFSNAVKTYYDDNPDATLADYLVNVALISEPEESDTFGVNRGRVTLMTLHSAKGLEFPVVFMVGMEEGLFPLSRAMDNKEELEEERRLCYVGITRAMRKLYMLHAAVRFQYGEMRANPPSRFLSELPPELCESLLPKPIQRRNDYAQSSDNDWDDNFSWGYDSRRTTEVRRDNSVFNFGGSAKTASSAKMGTINYGNNASKAVAKNSGDVNWKIAMTVKHRRFGIGKIIAVAGSGDKIMVTVAFENNGIKNLVAAQANLEIIGE